MYVPIIKREVRAERFPWQKGYNWHGMVNSTAPLNQPLPGEKAAPRFGGGWKYKLGICVGGSTIMIDLWFGMVIIAKAKRCPGCGKPLLRGQSTNARWPAVGWDHHAACPPK